MGAFARGSSTVVFFVTLESDAERVRPDFAALVSAHERVDYSRRGFVCSLPSLALSALPANCSARA